MTATIHTIHATPDGKDALYDEFRHRLDNITSRFKGPIVYGAQAMVLGYDAHVKTNSPEAAIASALVALRTLISRNYSDAAKMAMLDLCADIIRGALHEEDDDVQAPAS